MPKVAEDFGVSELCLGRWLRAFDAEDGNPGTTRQKSDELREPRRRDRLLKQENEVLRRTATT